MRKLLGLASVAALAVLTLAQSGDSRPSAGMALRVQQSTVVLKKGCSSGCGTAITPSWSFADSDLAQPGQVVFYPSLVFHYTFGDPPPAALSAPPAGAPPGGYWYSSPIAVTENENNFLPKYQFFLASKKPGTSVVTAYLLKAHAPTAADFQNAIVARSTAVVHFVTASTPEPTVLHWTLDFHRIVSSWEGNRPETIVAKGSGRFTIAHPVSGNRLANVTKASGTLTIVFVSGPLKDHWTLKVRSGGGYAAPSFRAVHLKIEVVDAGYTGCAADPEGDLLLQDGRGYRPDAFKFGICESGPVDSELPMTFYNVRANISPG
jgi:hypothetical protein